MCSPGNTGSDVECIFIFCCCRCAKECTWCSTCMLSVKKHMEGVRAKLCVCVCAVRMLFTRASHGIWSKMSEGRRGKCGLLVPDFVPEDRAVCDVPDTKPVGLFRGPLIIIWCRAPKHRFWCPAPKTSHFLPPCECGVKRKMRVYWSNLVIKKYSRH